MRVYITMGQNCEGLEGSKYTLGSFAYAQGIERLIAPCESFMLDSGAFTFLQASKKKRGSVNLDWDLYVDSYAAFINSHGVDLYLELDIDALVGYERVKAIRARLEAVTGKPSIPVWHKSRGKDEYLRLCETHPYVAIGGVAIKDIKPAEYKYFRWFIEQAHARGTKVHGLGFTRTELLHKYRFDSVDSSSWTCGTRFGALCWFDGREVHQHAKRAGQQIDGETANKHNFGEWLKFQRYADENL